MDDHVEHIRHQLDCRTLAEKYGVRFRQRSGEWWTAHCFNLEAHSRGDRNPSLSIGPTGYKCFSVNCGISGDVYDLIAHFEGLDIRSDFQRILQHAADEAGVDLEVMRQQSASFAPTAYHRRKDEGFRQTSRAVRKERKRADKLRERLRHTRSVPTHGPDFKEHFPDPHHKPFLLPRDHPRPGLMQLIWQIVADRPLGKGSVAWLRSRGIDPRVAHAYGCRDWTTAAADLDALFGDTPDDDLIASGLAQRRPDGSLKHWVGIRALDGEAWAQGLGFPVLHPGFPEAPMAWRWRLHEPLEMKSGARLKAMAQYSGDPHMPMIPLGLLAPSATQMADVARWPHSSKTPEAPRTAVVICEGEPDWLSVAEVAASLETEVAIVPIGLVAMSFGFPEEFIDVLRDAERILCVMDRGNTIKKDAARDARTGGEKVVDEIFGLLLYARAREHGDFDRAFAETTAQVVRALQPDDFDINDIHARGDGSLARLITEHLETIL